MLHLPFNSIRNGWWPPARRAPTPNRNERPAGSVVSMLVIHNISLPPGEFGGGYVEQFFTNQLDASEHPYFATIAGLQVSAHCFIDRRGQVTQFVSFDERAWHAGRSRFGDEVECNDFGIGIELEGTDTQAYSANQYQTLTKLSRDLMLRYPAITPERIAGHCEIAPGRKTDPGPAFDWALYRRLLSASLQAIEQPPALPKQALP